MESSHLHMIDINVNFNFSPATISTFTNFFVVPGEPEFGQPASNACLNLDNAPELLVIDFGQILNVVVLEENFGFSHGPTIQLETDQQLLARFAIGHYTLLEIKRQKAISSQEINEIESMRKALFADANSF